jgi:hypothetical protein
LKTQFIIPTFAIALVCTAAALGADRPASQPAAVTKPPQLTSEADLKLFRARLIAAETKHLDALLAPDGKVADLKGKSTVSMTALSYYLMFEMNANPKYRTAAVELADRTLKDMKAAKFGVLYIKEKERAGGEKFAGGGPPAFGWYCAALGYIYSKEGGRNDDLKYIATILDKFPWNDQGWWSADIDVNTGVSKQPMTKPSPINKNASIVLASAMMSQLLKDIDPDMSTRLKHKADQCLYKQILPAQQPDGFWHYGLTEKDPENKDILGYFMVTSEALIQLPQFTDSYRDPAFNAAVDKAGVFALREIASLTEPNKGTPNLKRTTQSTPPHYSFPGELKRGFQLGPILLGSGEYDEAVKIIDQAVKYFPYGNVGEDGAHAAGPTARMILMLSKAHAN